MPGNSNNHLKFVLIGDTETGKSSLLQKLVLKEIDSNLASTSALEVLAHTIEVNEKQTKLMLCSVPGREPFRTLAYSEYAETKAFVLVYDIGRRKTFDNLETWIKDIYDHVKGYDFKVMLVGNKSDLEERQVSQEDGETFANKHGLISFMETSAENGNNVEEVFIELVKKVQQPNVNASLRSLYHHNGGDNILVLASLTTSSRYTGITLLKNRAISHIVKGSQLSSASYLTLKEALNPNDFDRFETEINAQKQRLLNANLLPKDKLKSTPPKVTYENNGGANLGACLSLFFHHNNREKSIETLKKRAKAAIERGDLSSASLITLSQIDKDALREVFGEPKDGSQEATPHQGLQS